MQTAFKEKTALAAGGRSMVRVERSVIGLNSSDLLLWWRAMQDSGDLTRFVGAHHFLYFMFSEAQSVR
jgi:hypothetical protein